MTLKEQLPRHIGIIMDGNGRWAKKRGMPRKIGHREGAKTLKKIIRRCKDDGIECVSFFAFSTENWSRPKDEVDAILELLDSYLDDMRNYVDENVKVVFLGDKSVFSPTIRNKMLSLEYDSKDCTSMTLLLAFNYGGRDDIVTAARKAALMVSEGSITADSIDEKLLNGLLYTGDAPDVDLLIRTSGEQRISNFLIWQSAYAEYYFTDVLWPDFSENDLEMAIEEFAKRGRRFGGV